MKINQIIVEYSREVTAQKLGASLLAKFRKEPKQWQERVTGAATDYDDHALQYLLELVEKADPTKNKQYVPWIIRNYVNNPSLKFEDAVSKVGEPLLKFYKLVNKKQIPTPNNDIGRIKDLAQLVQVVDQYPDVEDKPKDVNRGQAKPYYDDQDIRVIIPEDETAACYYGQGTKWCTAAQNNNMFNRYNESGEMYIILPKKPEYPGEKYQFHFQSKQFMDEKDHRVNLRELRTRFPQLADIFAKQAEENGIIALDKNMDNVTEQLPTILPLFRNHLRTLIQRDSRRVAREIMGEVAAVSKLFKDFKDEVWEMAEIMMEEDVTPKATAIMYMISDLGIEVINDEDQLYDHLGELVSEIRVKSDLWIYITEMLEDMEDEEGQFDCAMAIDGEVTSMLINLIPSAFQEAVNAVKRSSGTQQ